MTRPWCILELWEAHRKQIPVLVLPVAGRRYDPAAARRFVLALEDSLEEQNPDGLALIRDHLRSQGEHDLGVLKDALLEVRALLCSTHV